MATSAKKTKAEAAADARAKAVQLKADQARKSRRNKQFGIGGAVFVILVVVAIIVVIVNGSSSTSASNTTTTVKGKPIGATSSYGISVGAKGVAGGKTTNNVATMNVWVDYQCPACESFETAYGSQITQLVDSGKLNLVVHPLNYLNSKEFDANNGYSLRSADAAAAVAAYSPDQFLAFHVALYKSQPAEPPSGHGLTNAQIADVAKGAGVNQKAIDAIKAGATDFSGWINSGTNTARGTDGLGKGLGSLDTPSGGKQGGTPQITLTSPSGQAFHWGTWSPQGTGLQAAIDSVMNGQSPS